MSFGGSSGRSSSFGRKGSFGGQKKTRKKKQEYHTHKVGKFEGPENADFEALKKRTVLALDRLGNQKFSLEPGAYSLDNWLTSLNLLLDDFEEKAPKESLSREYLEKRHSAVEELLKPVDVSDLQAELERLQNEERAINLKIIDINSERRAKREREMQTDSSLGESLKRKRDAKTLELEREKARLTEKRREAKSASFIRKIFSSSNASSIASIQRKIADLEKEIDDLSSEISNIQKKKERNIARINDETHKVDLDEESQLEEIRTKIQELEEKKLERLQMHERRKEITNQLADGISALKGPAEVASIAEASSEPVAEEGDSSH